jgi:2-polyprenyl-3-methyl-5-hydroxy-6-metoxy-1,4-benzoquinol methylase
MPFDKSQIHSESDYVAVYKNTHLLPPDFDYKFGYLSLLITDGLMEQYNILDIGCGTAGYYRLAKNAKTITGLDGAQEIVDEGRKLCADLGIKNITFIPETFENFKTDKKFDVVLNAVSGTYIPHTAQNIRKICGLLSASGFAVFGFCEPSGFKERIGRLIGRGRKNIITEGQFNAMFRTVPGAQIFMTIKRGSHVIVFIRNIAHS